jgi:hypothetical protein
MKTYALVFSASGIEVNISVTAEFNTRTKGLIYKSFVDEFITKWIRENELNGKEIAILDIELNEGKLNLFSQKDWKDVNSIELH